MKAASARYEAQIKAGEKHSGVDHMLHDLWTKHLRDEISAQPREEGRAMG